MSKIIVPKELQDQIIDLYCNKKLNRVQIKKELNLNFGDSVIKRILVENNIEIRTNPGALKGGRKKQKVDVDLQNKIIDAYQKGWGLDKIVKELSLPFSFDKVKSILKDNNIHIRNNKEAYQAMEKPELRKYPVNDDYSLESHNGAWLLGFIAADGYLPITKGAKNRITISLQRRDEEILQTIAKEINYKGPLCQYYSQDKYPETSLSFCSKKLREQIEKYGIGNNKTFKLNHLPKLKDEYMTDFIRGFFDGDGCIYEPKDKNKGVHISFCCACKSFLIDISDYLSLKYGVKKPSIHEQERVHIIYNINYYTKDSLILGNAFYNNDYIALPRKKKHFFDILEKRKH